MESTTDDIEMRVCRDEVASNEDITIEMVDIYVQWSIVLASDPLNNVYC